MMEARLIQLWSPLRGDLHEWSMVDAHLGGLPLSPGVLLTAPSDVSSLLDNIPTDISNYQSDLTKFLTKLLSEGHWSSW